MPANEQEKEI